MSIGQTLVAALKLLEPGAATEHPVEAAGDTARARVFLADNDRYSVVFRSLELGGGATVGEDVQAFLSDHAAAVVRSLAFLEEPLAVWELSAAEGTAQLRSSPPQREGEEVSYWEVVVQAAAEPTATLARYRWSPGMVERESVSYPATYALLARIADNLAAALAE